MRRLGLLAGALLALGASGAEPAADVLALPTTWRAEDGSPATLADFRGRWYVLSFVYTSCPGTCPRTTATLKRLDAALARAGTPLDTVVVSLDPDHDTPAAVRAYRARHQLLGARRWHLLVGAEDQLRTLTMLLDFHYARNEASGAIAHDNVVYLVGPDGTVRASQSSLEAPRAELLAAVRSQ